MRRSKPCFRYAIFSVESLRFASQLNGYAFTARSIPSGPWIASNTSAQSSALRHIGPSLSVVHERAIAPARETRPKLGRKPATPLVRAGDVMDPLVSEPIAKATQPDATAEPGPADEPLAPGESCSGIHGLRVYSFHQWFP